MIKRIELLEKNPLESTVFADQLETANIAFKIISQPVGVYEVPTTIFEVAESDYLKAMEILGSIDLSIKTTTDWKVESGGIMNFFRGKAFNLFLIILTVVIELFFLITFTFKIMNGELPKLALTVTIFLIGLLIMSIAILKKELVKPKNENKDK